MDREKPAQGDNTNESATAFEVKQRFWGCIVHRIQGPVVLVQVSEQIVLTLGLSLMAGAILALRGPAPGIRAEPSRAFLALMLILAGLAILRFGTGDAAIGFKVGSARRQVRDIVHGRVSHARRSGRMRTDPSVSLHIERSGCKRHPRALVLHHRGECEGLCLARGPERALRALRQRLSHDLRLDA